jgi:hypothetical protein
LAVLFHGTSEQHLPAILRHGLRPRRSHGNNNWKHSATSCPDGVYLTNAYALHFAYQATNPPARLAVLELDQTQLDESLMCADEDAVEQAMRGRDEMTGWSMKRRTAYYRKRLMNFPWDTSLQAIGNCVHMGAIPATVIKRIALIERTTYTQFVMRGHDPTITLMNYHLSGEKYRKTMQWLFDPETVEQKTIEFETSDGDKISYHEYPILTHRDGIQVFECEELLSTPALAA